MKTITQQLLELDPTLSLHDEGEWSNTQTRYSAFNDAGVECEVGEFLYSMVRILKPERVLETGTHWGIGAAYLGMGLKDNRYGTMCTVEFLPEIHARACERMKKLGLGGAGDADEIVFCKLADARDLVPERDYQLILLDTEPQTRFAELVKFYDHLSPGGFVFIHDLHRHMHQIENEEHGFAWPFGPVPEKIKYLVEFDKLRPFHFPTPRGLTGFYKPRDDDYNWGFGWEPTEKK